MKENEKIRKAARTASVPLWRVAAKLGVSEGTLLNWLRFPLQGDKEVRIMAAITILEQEVV